MSAKNPASAASTQAATPKSVGWFIFKIIIDSLPILVTGITAWLLLSNLGSDKKFGQLSLNAFQWPGFLKIAATETNLQSKAIHGILVFTTFMFVGCNTIIFLIENLIAFTRVKNKLLFLAWALTFIVWLPIVFWLPKVYFHWDARWIAPHPDEVVALVIFVIFFFVDLINWRVYGSGGDQHDVIDSRFAIYQAAFVDFPVIAGIGISIYLANNLTQFFGDSEGQYVFGFFSGAAVMHLATSQIIYTILAIWRDASKKKLIST